ncbi:hypothetical protein AVEN_96490-1 [Araneus ventricosus]|uniref:Uncharacterized protein n=1 Tax=Araneus ventricosus TaxID=182803 RepID=A0A4Y2CTS8_ARAVE|nr:hypothetical protein AVEN_96490-1 [Araneus ventricosus]
MTSFNEYFIANAQFVLPIDVVMYVGFVSFLKRGAFAEAKALVGPVCLKRMWNGFDKHSENSIRQPETANSSYDGMERFQKEIDFQTMQSRAGTSSYPN